MKRILVIALVLVLVVLFYIQVQTGSTSATSIAFTVSVAEQIKDLSAKEKANFKGREIAKIGSVHRTRIGRFEVEIIGLNPVSGGIEFYARAWDLRGNQVALGTGVETERFKIINPPIMVRDGTFHTRIEDGTGLELQVPNFKEDLREALLQSLEHTIFISHKKGIVPKAGSVGNTTSTFYSAAGANSPVDGFAVRDGVVSESWATIIAGAGTASDDTAGADVRIVHMDSTATTDQWGALYRSIFLFDTSSIGVGVTISSAVMSIWGNSKVDQGIAISPDIDIYTSTPASNAAVAATDFTQIGFTSQTGSPITYNNWSTTGYNDFTFNAIGRGNISLTGISKFGARNANYDVAAVAPTWSSFASHILRGSYADTAGTTNDPKLVVVHGAAVPEGNLWQRRSFEGRGFITTTNEITITPSAETNFVLIRNPTASGKLHRANELVVTVRTEGQNVRLRIYKNPTVTADGIPLAVNNVKTGGNTPVSQVFSLPMTSSLGQLMAAYSRNANSLDRPFDLTLYLEQGESYLITAQGTAIGNDYILTYTFVEE